MKKSLTSLLTTTVLATTIFTGCTNHKEALKVLPSELAIADDCRNQNKSFEHDCYDLIAYKNSFAQIRLGIIAQTKGNHTEAFQRYTLAQKKGNFYANALLADLYNKGEGVQKDKDKVIDLLKDVDEVDPIAAYKLAYYYMDKKDYTQAIELLEFAALNNVKKAQYKLYKIYSEGTITKINLDKSKEWFIKYEDKSNSFISKIYGI